ncbi:hypothetical protein Ddc_02500 [Ditylenchus destructor]|nr:hypothetical protein Ddc_02500 [Ditylenchus destructor]
MGKTKILPELIFDFLRYLNRDDLDRLTLVCRLLNSFIERYFHLTPYRIFETLQIINGKYRLFNRIPKNKWTPFSTIAVWHPNRDDYTVKQFLASEALSPRNISLSESYSYAEMSPYLGPNIRLRYTLLHVSSMTSSSEIVSELESLSHVWSQHKLHLYKSGPEPIFDDDMIWNADEWLPLLKSPTDLLQCQYLRLDFGDFPLKDYEVLYTVKLITIGRGYRQEHVKYWVQFLEKEGVKPLLVLPYIYDYCVDRAYFDFNVVDYFFQAFSNATSPASFMVEFELSTELGLQGLDERREKNFFTKEILELKKGSMECIGPFYHRNEVYYTLERYSI